MPVRNAIHPRYPCNGPVLVRHMSAHILHDVRLKDGENPCGFCLSTYPEALTCICVPGPNKNRTESRKQDTHWDFELLKLSLKPEIAMDTAGPDAARYTSHTLIRCKSSKHHIVSIRKLFRTF